MFGPKLKSEKGREDGTELADPSRRRFLAMVAGAGAAALAKPLSAKAEAMPVSGIEKTRAEGIRRMRQAALTKNEEIISMFVKKSGTGRWIEYGGTGSATHGVVPFENIRLALAETGSSAEMFHTHDASYIAQCRGKDFTKDIEAGLCPMPPSFEDIVGLIQTKQFLKNDAHRFSEAVVDPIGVWKYDLIPNHPFVRGFARALTRVRASADHIPARLSKELKEALKVRGLTDADPRLQMYRLFQDGDSLEPDLRDELERIAKPMTELLGTKEFQAVVTRELQVPMADYRDPRERAQAIAAYAGLGVSVSFTPHEAPRGA